MSNLTSYVICPDDNSDTCPDDYSLMIRERCTSGFSNDDATNEFIYRVASQAQPSSGGVSFIRGDWTADVVVNPDIVGERFLGYNFKRSGLIANLIKQKLQNTYQKNTYSVGWTTVAAAMSTRAGIGALSFSHVDNEVRDYILKMGVIDCLSWFETQVHNLFGPVNFELVSLPEEEGDDGCEGFYIGMRIFCSLSTREFKCARQKLTLLLEESRWEDSWPRFSIFKRRVSDEGNRVFGNGKISTAT